VPSTAAAAQDMHMGTASGAFKEPGNEDFVFLKNYSADRTYPFPVSPEAVNTAAYMHKAVFAAVQGGKGRGTHQLAFLQFGGAYRAGIGISGHTLTGGFAAALSTGMRSSPGGNTHAEEEGIAEPEQDDSDDCKNQCFKNALHLTKRPPTRRPWRLLPIPV